MLTSVRQKVVAFPSSVTLTPSPGEPVAVRATGTPSASSVVPSRDIPNHTSAPNAKPSRNRRTSTDTESAEAAGVPAQLPRLLQTLSCTPRSQRHHPCPVRTQSAPSPLWKRVSGTARPRGVGDQSARSATTATATMPPTVRSSWPPIQQGTESTTMPPCGHGGRTIRINKQLTRCDRRLMFQLCTSVGSDKLRAVG